MQHRMRGSVMLNKYAAMELKHTESESEYADRKHTAILMKVYFEGLQIGMRSTSLHPFHLYL